MYLSMDKPGPIYPDYPNFYPRYLTLSKLFIQIRIGYECGWVRYRLDTELDFFIRHRSALALFSTGFLSGFHPYPKLLLRIQIECDLVKIEYKPYPSFWLHLTMSGFSLLYLEWFCMKKKLSTYFTHYCEFNLMFYAIMCVKMGSTNRNHIFSFVFVCFY